MIRRTLLLLSAGVAASFNVAAADILPEQVARSAQRHYPDVLAALAGEDLAAAKRLSASGAFDTVFRSEANTRLTGFYSGDILTTEVERPLGTLGSKVYGGYRVSDGDFPIYDDYNFTNRLGEAKIGVLFSLLRNRSIDEIRLDVRQADLAIQEAEINVFLTRLGIQQKALVAYWRWVAAGRELKAYRDLLRLAEDRDSALRREVASGARAEIFLTENAQNLTRRREFVRQAERALALAANSLALYLRDDGGNTITPTSDDLPSAVPIPQGSAEFDEATMLDRQPAVRLLEISEAKLKNTRALAENDLKPEFNIKLEASNDFGAIGAGGVSRDPGEVAAIATFTVPIGRRDARGRVRAAEAELSALRQRQRLTRDQIMRQLNDIIANLTAARDILRLTKQEVSLADTMRQAEAQRFRGGASDFFLVNLREEAFADARVKLARAEYSLAAAQITFNAAVIDTDSLGLAPR
ncbi:MAG: TolC family protein [Parvularculaceae bacterium]|nr:TolC family protein [Parvularculaceae bacterium]